MSKEKRFLLTGIISGLFILTFYVWITSVGHWNQWPTRSNYYDALATSFRHGQLSLELTPNYRALLALQNPYDPNLRTGLHYPLDVSLYKGKFYLYFGPVPALMLLIPKMFTSREIGDQYLVLAFI